jgi:hypothetical protein
VTATRGFNQPEERTMLSLFDFAILVIVVAAMPLVIKAGR